MTHFVELNMVPKFERLLAVSIRFLLARYLEMSCSVIIILIPTCKLYKLHLVIILNVLIIFNVISCRRTGVPLNINARKDSHGFENVDDYFPDSGGVIM